MIPKIAIQRDIIRGKEIIQILESLGGNNLYAMTGSIFSCYYINNHYNIDGNSLEFIKKLGYTIYTLEEFEREFPFKIGDIVLLKGTNNPYEIIELEWFMNKLCYKLNNGFHYAPEALTTYKEMKEKRNITLTLEKAKEWYKKGGELKEVALQVYSEKELTNIDLPKTWEEFCKNYPIMNGEYYIDSSCFIVTSYENVEDRNIEMDKNMCPSQKSAEAHLAMIQLEQLRDCYRQGDIPDFTKAISKYCIAKINKRIDVVESSYTSYFLSFTKKEVAEKFLTNFKPLIKIAEDYI